MRRLGAGLLGAGCGWLLALWTALALRWWRPEQVPPGMLLATANFFSAAFAYLLGLYGLTARPRPASRAGARQLARGWLEGVALGVLALAVGAAGTLYFSPDVRDLVRLGTPLSEVLPLYARLLGRALVLGSLSLGLPLGFPLAAWLVRRALGGAAQEVRRERSRWAP